MSPRDTVALSRPNDVKEFLRVLPLGEIPREPGLGIFVADGEAIDAGTFLRHLSHRGSLPGQIVFVTTPVEFVPRLPADQRAWLADLGNGLFLATVHHGFDERPDVPAALASLPGLDLDAPTTRYHIVRKGPSRATLAALPAWRQALFMLRSSICMTPAEYFCLPQHQVMEVADDTPSGPRCFVFRATGAVRSRR